MNFKELNYASNATAPSLKLFFQIAIPLTFVVVVLPLTAGALLHLLIKLKSFLLLHIIIDISMFVMLLLNIASLENGSIWTVAQIYIFILILRLSIERCLNDSALLKTGGWSAVWENFKAHAWPKYLDLAFASLFISVLPTGYKPIFSYIIVCLFFIHRLVRQLYTMWCRSRKQNH